MPRASPPLLRFSHYSIFFFHHHSLEIKLHRSYIQFAPFLRSFLTKLTSSTSPIPIQFLFSRSDTRESKKLEKRALRSERASDVITGGGSGSSCHGGKFSTRQMERRKIVCRNGGKWKIDRRFGSLGFAPPARPFSTFLFFFFVCHSTSFFFVFACRDLRSRGWSSSRGGEARKARKKRKKREERKEEEKVERTGYILLPVRLVFQLYYLRLWAGKAQLWKFN